MKTAKEYLHQKNLNLHLKLQSNRLSTEVCEAMEDFALDFAADLMPNDDNFRDLIIDMRTAQKSYFATRKIKYLIRSKELEKKVDEMLKK